jgi:1-acyl-sn-glycerol-3-phosphate acyltransferase
MNRQPYETPPHWWSPNLSLRWVRFWRPLRKRRTLHQHGLQQVEVRGAEHLTAAMAAGQSVLITPNHPTHADPYALLEVCDLLQTPFYFMTAWQVFAMTHWLGRHVLRQHGAFSINREGVDLRALRHAVSILERGEHPLVIFPEGEVFHLNDRATHFRRGAATMALRAAQRSGREVACVPCGLKYQFVDDPMPRLLALMARLEQRLLWEPTPGMPLVRRIARVAEGVLTTKECEYFGQTGSGSLPQRSERLMHALLGRMEDRYGILTPKTAVPERVKQLRQRAIARREADPNSTEQTRRDLDDLFFVNQLFSYPAGYLTRQPSIERLAETLDKLEEDVLHVPTANRRGLRKAVVSFGAPVLASAQPGQRLSAAELTAALQQRVQLLLDEINATAPRVEPAPQADLASMPDLQFA